MRYRTPTTTPPTPTRERVQQRANVAASVLFVLGCVGFYSPRLETSAITAFLTGSVLFLVGSVCSLPGRVERARPGERQPTGARP